MHEDEKRVNLEGIFYDKEGNFTPLTSGAIRIKFKFNGLDSRPGVHAIIEGDESFTGYYKIQNTHTEEEYNMDISVKKGVKYTIKAKTTTVTGARCVSCNICGTFAPSNLIEKRSTKNE